MLSREISLRRSPKFDMGKCSVAMPGQAAEHEVVPCNSNLREAQSAAGSVIRFQADAFLSDFLCKNAVVFQCPCRLVQIDRRKIQGTFKGYFLKIFCLKTKKFAKIVAGPASSG